VAASCERERKREEGGNGRGLNSTGSAPDQTLSEWDSLSERKQQT
jgi:hypothetical protein